MNVEVFNLVLEENETRFSVQHESYECKCRVNEGAHNPKWKWNHDKCWYECK